MRSSRPQPCAGAAVAPVPGCSAQAAALASRRLPMQYGGPSQHDDAPAAARASGIRWRSPSRRSRTRERHRREAVATIYAVIRTSQKHFSPTSQERLHRLKGTVRDRNDSAQNRPLVAVAQEVIGPKGLRDSLAAKRSPDGASPHAPAVAKRIARWGAAGEEGQSCGQRLPVEAGRARRSGSCSPRGLRRPVC